MMLPTIDERLSISWDGVRTCDDDKVKGESPSRPDDVLSRLVAEFQSTTSSSYNAPHQIKIDDGGDHDNENSLYESNGKGSFGKSLEHDETADVLSRLVAQFQAEAGKGRQDANLKTTQTRCTRRCDRPTEEKRADLLFKCIAAAEKVFAANSLTLDQLKEYELICSSACSRLLYKERRNDYKSGACSSTSFIESSEAAQL